MAINNNNNSNPSNTAYLEAGTAGVEGMILVHGLANMHLALLLDDFCTILHENGIKRLAIDLSDCTGMDSTFMGTVSAISAAYGENEDGWMCLINVSPENRRLLEMLGVAELVQTREHFPLEPLTMARVDLPSTDDPTKRIMLVKRVHERLMEVDERNREKFGSFLRMLNDSLINEMPGNEKFRL